MMYQYNRKDIGHLPMTQYQYMNSKNLKTQMNSACIAGFNYTVIIRYWQVLFTETVYLGEQIITRITAGVYCNLFCWVTL